MSEEEQSPGDRQRLAQENNNPTVGRNLLNKS